MKQGCEAICDLSMPDAFSGIAVVSMHRIVDSERLSTSSAMSAMRSSGHYIHELKSVR